MIFVALALVGLGLGDLVRWSADPVGRLHALGAAAAGTTAVAAVAALSGMEGRSLALVVAIAFAILALWEAFDLLPARYAKPELALGLVAGLIAVLTALAGSADPVEGDLARWYSGLGFDFTDRIPVDQFLLGVGACALLLVTGNRIVRFALAATETSLPKGEGTMRGGRVLGPMERLIVAASIVSGAAAGAGFVIAAKGLLRFREIQGSRDDDPGRRGRRVPTRVDEITEYFLIGTFTSVFVACVLSVLVLAAA
jgi:hypothetical protein